MSSGLAPFCCQKCAPFSFKQQKKMCQGVFIKALEWNWHPAAPVGTWLDYQQCTAFELSSAPGFWTTTVHSNSNVSLSAFNQMSVRISFSLWCCKTQQRSIWQFNTGDCGLYSPLHHFITAAWRPSAEPSLRFNSRWGFSSCGIVSYKAYQNKPLITHFIVIVIPV